MTSAQGSGSRRSASPSRSGFSVCSATAIDCLDGVPAELVAQRRVHLGGERLVLARREAGEKGERDRGGGHALVDRLEDGPATLARILDVAPDLLEAWIFGERALEQVEQPAADHRAVLPEGRELPEVELELGGVHDLEPLGEGLHHPVLAPVVDHLHAVPGARGADVRVATLLSEGLQRRLDALERLVLSADHHAVAAFQAPDTARDACIEEENSPLLRRSEE